MVTTCHICLRRGNQEFTTFTDEDFGVWNDLSIPPGELLSICSTCYGLLQFGAPIVNQLVSEIAEGGYVDIFGWPVSVQLSPVIFFRSYLQKVCDCEDRSQSFDLKDSLRNLIYRAVVKEKFSEYNPKLSMDVRFDCSLGVPEELMKAVNQILRRKGAGKKFRTRQSVNIADVQQFMDMTKSDALLVWKELFPTKEPLSDPQQARLKLAAKYLEEPIRALPKMTITLRRETLFLVGKYSKRTRDFGQSQWDQHATSVAETICPVVCELFKSPVDKCLFSASGREDMDVRMLGAGRPFVLQLGDAKCLAPLLDGGKMLSELVIDTGDVIVKGLTWVDKGVMDWLHWSTEQHVKIYRCVIWSEDCLPSQDVLNEVKNSKTNVKVYQKTPLRVLHRRTENTREKTMYSIETERLNDHYAIVTLKASAGAYIKEFIHGDFGRTEPSFCDVVFGRYVRCDILQLDVLEVEQDDDEGYVPLWDRN